MRCYRRVACAGVLFQLLLGIAPASTWAGGIMRIDPEREARWQAAEKQAEAWEQAGASAAPAMIAAACGEDDEMAPAARGALQSIGKDALGALADAAVTREPKCQLSQVVAGIVCQSGGAAPTIATFLHDPRPPVVQMGLRTLEAAVDTEHGHTCPQKDRVVEAALPALDGLLASSDRRALGEVTWAVRKIGSAAAPLLPRLLRLLEADAATIVHALYAIGALGTAAEAAVPEILPLVGRQGHVRRAAIEALANIGPASAKVLPRLVPILRSAWPGVCRTAPVYSEEDALVGEVLFAAAHIGGPDAEPLVADLAEGFPRMRACRTASVKSWLDSFKKLGGHARAAAGIIDAIAEDPDEHVAQRKEALEALDAVGAPLAWLWRLHRLRGALTRKEQIFRRRERNGPAMQILPPPPPTPPVPRELALCREEADIKPPAAPDLPADVKRNPAFSACVRQRLCGPDEKAFSTTLAKCCAVYAAPWPSFCTSATR